MEVTLTDFLNQLKTITMEKERTENLIKIMQAFLEGETIEERIVFLNNRTAGWVTHTGNDWNTTKYEYRIKPKPQYRSFKNGNECWEEMQKHQPFGWVKIYNCYNHITEVNNENLFINGGYFDLESAYKNVAFADGSVFGVKNDDPEVKTTKTYTVYVDEVFAPIPFIKTIKKTLHLDLKEAKNIADKTRKETHRIDNLSKKEAEKIVAEINMCGGKAFVSNNQICI